MDKGKWKEAIRLHLDDLTGLEKDIAAYFLQEADQCQDLSSQALTQTLHVSKAALTRFAKKIGYQGYRELIFYVTSHRQEEQLIEGAIASQKVLRDYEKVLSFASQAPSDLQPLQIAQLIEGAERVYFFGKGSSGLVARELKLRLMRLGVVCEALTERDSFAWTTSILDDKCLVIAFSLSGQTRSVIQSLKQAKKQGAKTVLVTAAKLEKQVFDHILPVANLGKLDYGMGISPQIPMLLMVDLIYSHFLEINRARKEKIFHSYWENKAFSQDR